MASNKTTWTVAEDLTISRCIENGISKWSEIAKLLPGSRSGKQCRERWANHLDPKLKRTQWTDEEDQLLFSLQEKYGNRWSKMSQIMKGRSENDLKNRWNSTNRRKSTRIKERILHPPLLKQVESTQIREVMTTHEAPMIKSVESLSFTNDKSLIHNSQSHPDKIFHRITASDGSEMLGLNEYDILALQVADLYLQTQKIANTIYTNHSSQKTVSMVSNSLNSSSSYQQILGSNSKPAMSAYNPTNPIAMQSNYSSSTDLLQLYYDHDFFMDSPNSSSQSPQIVNSLSQFQNPTSVEIAKDFTRNPYINTLTTHTSTADASESSTQNKFYTADIFEKQIDPNIYHNDCWSTQTRSLGNVSASDNSDNSLLNALALTTTNSTESSAVQFRDDNNNIHRSIALSPISIPPFSKTISYNSSIVTFSGYNSPFAVPTRCNSPFIMFEEIFKPTVTADLEHQHFHISQASCQDTNDHVAPIPSTSSKLIMEAAQDLLELHTN